MSINKSAFIRYRTIDSCLVNKFSRPSKVYIQQKCCDAIGEHVSISTIEKDMQDMRHDAKLGYFAPIKYNKADNYYYYSLPGFSIFNISLTKEQLSSLQLILTYCNNSILPHQIDFFPLVKAIDVIDSCFNLSVQSNETVMNEFEDYRKIA